MTQSGWCWGWKLGLASCLAIGGALTGSGDYACAQITPDGTLGAESSVVTPTNIDGLPTARIDGGATRGSNLFHSFDDFSVPTGGAGYFNNASNIQNIISRVTGESISKIDGLLRANGTANLFLLNPNGIIFGPKASLNIGGSFVASTASAANFESGTQFSATAPTTTPLLTVSVPLGLQFGGNAGRILVQGDRQGTRTRSELIDTTVGLRVQPNQTLAFVGGDVALEGGTLKTAGGRIELGSVAGSGLVSMAPIDKGWALGYSGISTFGKVQLSDAAAVDASGAGGGDIQVWGRWVTLTGGSQIEASTLGSKPGGTLEVIGSESVELTGSGTGLFAQVYRGATGTGGSLTIETGQLIVREGARVDASTYGAGQGGNLVVKASDSVELTGTSADGQFASGLFTDVQPEATGAGGSLTLETGQLIVRDGARVDASTYGAGQGGNLVVKASDSVELTGTSADGQFASGLFTDVQPEATGAGGSLTLETGQLIVRDGAQIGANTLGAGQGGNLVVKASDSVELTGTSADGQFASGLFTDVQSEATGAGGNLTLETRRLILQDGATVNSNIRGAGQGGNLTVRASDSVELIGISPDGRFVSGLGSQVYPEATGPGGDLNLETKRLIVREGAAVTTETFGMGPAGSLSVRASGSVEVIGTSANGEAVSKLTTQTNPGSTGAGGNLIVETERLIVRDGGQIGSATFGAGQGGNLVVKASDSVELTGTSAFDSRFASNLGTPVATRGVMGTAGHLTVETRRLIVQNGAAVTTSTFGAGRGGNLTVRASDSVELSGTSADRFPSRFTARTESAGDAGGLTIETRQLTVRDGAEVTVSSEGTGSAGELVVQADNLLLDNQGKLRASTASGKGGSISLQVSDLTLMRRDSLISAEARGTGNGGNITLNAP